MTYTPKGLGEERGTRRGIVRCNHWNEGDDDIPIVYPIDQVLLMDINAYSLL
jgi:hypothetical protein